MSIPPTKILLGFKSCKMDKICLLLGFLYIGTISFGQAPDSLSFQAVIRNEDGSLLTNQMVSARIGIYQGAEDGTIVYEETHTGNTNANGLLTLIIGGGTVQSGSFSSIDWSVGPYFIKRDIDPAGGTNYLISGTSRFLSVPYALYALSSGSGGGGDNLGDHIADEDLDMDGNIIKSSDASKSLKILANLEGQGIEIEAQSGGINFYSGDTIFLTSNLVYVESLSGKLYSFPKSSGEEGALLIREGNTSDEFDRNTQWTPYKFPLVDGSSNQVLQTNGEGTVSWTDLSSSGGSIGINDLLDAVKTSTSKGNLVLGSVIDTTSVNFTYNTAVGIEALVNNTEGKGNTAFGYQALKAQTGYKLYNTAVGYQALENNLGDYNTAVGSNALGSHTNGYGNVAMGMDALKSLSGTNLFNVSVGYQALQALPSGNGNTALGTWAGLNKGGGSDNVIIGFNAAREGGNGGSNTLVGYGAGYYATGSRNQALGLYAGYRLTGNNNTSIGYYAGVIDLSTNVSGSNNTYIGNEATPTSTSPSNEIVLGNSSIANVYTAGELTLGTSTTSIKYTNQRPSGNNYCLVGSTDGTTKWLNCSLGSRIVNQDSDILRNFKSLESKSIENSVGWQDNQSKLKELEEKLGNQQKLIEAQMELIKELQRKIEGK